ncbi:MAG TPA: dihydrodipicolinate synthase family protein [Chloroflexota bacterium]
MTTKHLSGVVAILVIPFTDDDRLDLSGLARVAEHTIGLGVHGIGIGLASEYLALSDVECVAVARTLVEAARGRVPVMMSCARPSTAATIELARAISVRGVDALMVLPPYVLPPGGTGLVAHYRAVAGAVTTPIVVQDAPQMSGASLSAEMLAGLVREVSSIRYLKIEALPSVPKIAELARLLAGDPKGDGALIGGAGGLHLLDELRRGARATMPGCSYADIFVRVWDAFQSDDLATARHALHRALPLLLFANQSFSAFVGTQKEWLRRMGVIESARLRAPAEQVSDEIYAEFAELLEDAR